MSLLFVNRALHAEWRRVCLELATYALANQAPSPPSPNTAEPPPEEWAECLNVIMGFLRSGELGRNSAMTIALNAVQMGVPEEHLFPLYYLLGWDHTPDGRYCLNRTEVHGCPIVINDAFPLRPRVDALVNEGQIHGNRVGRVSLPLPQFLNTPIIPMGDGFRVRFFRSARPDPDELGGWSLNPHISSHAQWNRDDAPGIFPATLTTESRFGYAGNIRIATCDEINQMFERDIRVGDLFDSPVVNPRQFFDSVGLRNVFDRAQSEREGSAEAPRPMPTDTTTTNVPAPSTGYPPAQRPRRGTQTADFEAGFQSALGRVYQTSPRAARRPQPQPSDRPTQAGIHTINSLAEIHSDIEPATSDQTLADRGAVQHLAYLGALGVDTSAIAAPAPAPGTPQPPASGTWRTMSYGMSYGDTRSSNTPDTSQ